MSAIPNQSAADALALMLEEGFKKDNPALVREAISLLEAQGHDCVDAKERLTEMVLLMMTSFSITYLKFS